MAVIAGARTFHQVKATVRAGFLPVMKVSWITSPLALAFAQKFLPEQTWVPFFNIIAFVIGTYINAHTKKKRLAALRKKVSRTSFPCYREEIYVAQDETNVLYPFSTMRDDVQMITQNQTTRNSGLERWADARLESMVSPENLDGMENNILFCVIWGGGAV